MLSAWKSYCSGVPQRWVFAVMGCLSVMNAYAMRICLSLAITEMVPIANTFSSNNTGSDQSCSMSASDLEPTSSNSSSSRRGGTYEWDEYTQGIILSSFFGGYMLTHIPGGVMADKFGGKYTLGLGILSTAIFTLLTPTVVRAYDSTGLIILRILMGLGEGTTFPAVAVLIAQWAPPHERSKIGATVMSGMHVGVVLGTALSGVLIRYSSIGWPMVFYFHGTLGVVWFVAWVFLCYDDPEVHPFISEKEREYLRETMKEQTHRQTALTPWRHLLTSVPLWALIFANSCHSWGYFTMTTDLPLYMNKILKFSVQANGFLSALPFVFMGFMTVVGSWLADCAIATGGLSTTEVRKICTTIASVGPAIFIISASYAGCDRTLVVIFFNLGMTMMGLGPCGLLVNVIDLAPNHAGTGMAIVNGVASLIGFAAPFVVGVLTPNQTLLEWRIVFWLASTLYLVGALIFGVWGDGAVQYWNEPDFQMHRRTVVKKKEVTSGANESP